MLRSVVRRPVLSLAVVGLTLLTAACGDDDDPSEPRPDAGITAMLLTVAGQMVTVDDSGNVSGTLESIPFGPAPVTASFLGRNGQPATSVTPGRYVFEVVFGDTLALAWAPGAGFSGTLTARAAGSYPMTFRLRDTDNDGTEIFLTRQLPVDIGVARVRMVFGNDTMVVDAVPPLPGVLDPVPVGDVPVSVTFLGANGEPAPIVTDEAFAVIITSSDTNIVRWVQGDAFSGTLRGVAPGVASISVRLRSAANGALSFRHVISVVVR